jgi:diguanylate cyclase (GGDEF)-like protein/PAS domain S-box-containing protein
MTRFPIEANLSIALSDQLSVLSVSDGIEELLGFSRADFLDGRVRLQDRIHPDDAQIAELLFCAGAADCGGTIHLRLRHADGGVRCVRGEYSRERGGCGPLKLFLQDAKSLYREAGAPAELAAISPTMEVVDNFMYFKDRNHVFTAANRKALEAFGGMGTGGPGLLGQTDYDLFPEETADRQYRLEVEVFAGKATISEMELVQTIDGKRVWLENRKYPVQNGAGQVIGLFAVARNITQRVEALEKLREQEESLREAQKIARVSSYVMDIGAGVWKGSDALDEVLGIDASYPRTFEDWRELVHPEDRARMGSHLAEEIARKSVSFSTEYRIVRPTDRAVRWLRGQGRIEYDTDGMPTILRGTNQDITESKQAEHALRESKELFQLFIKHAPAALAMFDVEMRCLAASRRWLEDFSLGGREVIGRTLYEIFPNLPESWKEEHRRALAGESVPADERLFDPADGAVRWVRREIIPWRTGNGAIGGVVIFSEDITRQKQTEERLRLAASVFTHSSEGIMITDAAATILEVNESFTRITGYSRDEVVGQNPRILQSGLQSREFFANMWHSLLEKGHWYGEIWNRAKSGDVFAEMLTINAIRDATGRAQQYVALFSDVTAIKKQEEQLERLTHYDLLTGLPNRVLFADRLRQAMAQTHRRKRLLAVAVLDLDGFKGINDRHGRTMGDRLLTALADRMKHALREGDTLARLGGDEFAAVMLDLADVDVSVPMLSRLLAAASEEMRIGEIAVCVSASAGVTFYPQTEEIDADLLLRQADQAMYQAKLAGRNRFHIFDPEADLTVRGRHENLERIRRGMAEEEFVLYYQPQVNMRTGKVEGAEALLRWQHPERGLLLPGLFLPVVEDHPLAVELGEWVIDTALGQMETWRKQGLDLPVSVNVGALQLQQADFVERLRAILAAHPEVDPSNLELEVLETSALRDVGQSSQVLHDCHEIGVTFALDDFGAGYSSLTYLKRLPVSTLKIDRGFVSDMLDDPEDLTILEGVLSLAAAFRRDVIAEGVETAEQGLILLQLGCDLAQGYGIAQPMPAADMPAWVASWRPDPSWANVPVASADDRSLLCAGIEHRAWLAAFEAFLLGKSASPPVLDSRHCRFGAWLAAESRTARGALPAFQELDELHRHFHSVAAEMAPSQADGRGGESPARLNELHDLRDRLLNLLEGLRRTSKNCGEALSS